MQKSQNVPNYRESYGKVEFVVSVLRDDTSIKSLSSSYIVHVFGVIESSMQLFELTRI